MRLLFLFTLVVVFSVKNEVLCRMLKGLNNNNVIPNHKAQDYRLDGLIEYLSNLGNLGTIAGIEIVFPRGIEAPNYRLSDGKVERYYDPLKYHGIYNRVRLNKLDSDLFGVMQIYAPKIDISFNYQTNIGSGSFGFVMTHSPLQIQMDLAIVNGGNCEIIRNEHDSHYTFAKERMKLLPKFNPESEAGRRLLEELMNTWLPMLYQIIIKSKVQGIIKEIKQTLLQNPQKFPEIKLHCLNIV